MVRRYTLHDLNEMLRKDEIVAQFINYTGMNLIFFFDSYVNKGLIEPLDEYYNSDAELVGPLAAVDELELVPGLLQGLLVAHGLREPPKLLEAEVCQAECPLYSAQCHVCLLRRAEGGRAAASACRRGRVRRFNP